MTLRSQGMHNSLVEVVVQQHKVLSSVTCHIVVPFWQCLEQCLHDHPVGFEISTVKAAVLGAACSIVTQHQVFPQDCATDQNWNLVVDNNNVEVVMQVSCPREIAPAC